MVFTYDYFKDCNRIGACRFVLVQIASAGDELYRCSDGTFTNRVERQCALYEAKGRVIVQGAGDPAKKPFAEVKLSESRGMHRGH